MGDAEVVRSVRNGDRGAYRVLVDRYAPMVFAVVRRYCEESWDADDLAQDIFVRAFEGLDGFRGDASFSSWLYRIAVNRCRDYARREQLNPGSARQVERVEFAGDAPRPATRTPEEELERKELGRRLREALEALQPEYAVPFLLKYERGLSYKEMSDLLGATVGSLKVRVHRARKALQDLLEDCI